ncbi:MAG: hypothetical protein ACR2QO_12465 [Acidimicrobiales bacterium]
MTRSHGMGRSATPGARGPSSGSDEEGTSLRHVMLQAGLDVLDRDGIGLGASSVTYARVFRYLEDEYSIRVTRASVHERIWDSHEEFQRDVLAEAVRYLPAEVSQAEDTVLSSTVENLVASATPASARRSEFARLAGHSLFLATLHSPSSLEIQSMKALAADPAGQSTSAVLQRLLSARAKRLRSLRSRRISEVTHQLGLTVRPELGLTSGEAHDLFCIMATNLFLGGALNYHAGCRDIVEPVNFMGTPTGVQQPWLVASIGLKAFLDLLFEADGVGERDREQLDWRVGSAPRLEVRTELPAPPRRSRLELRQLVLSAAVELLLRDGVGLRPTSGYATVFAYLRETQGLVLHRSSVHNRIWSSNDEFWTEVLAEGIERAPSPTAAAQSARDALDERVASDDASHAKQPVVDVIREFVSAQVDSLLNSQDYVRYQLIKATLPKLTPSPAVSKLQETTYAAYAHRLEQYSAAIDQYVLHGGLRVRPELQLDESAAVKIMSVLSFTSTTGAIFDRMAGIRTSERVFKLPRDREPDRYDDWLPPAIAAVAYFEQLFETNPT